jgi:hypothetical protein
MSSGDIKGFYRQKKKGGVGVTKPSASSSKKSKQYTGGASVGVSDTSQTPALVCRGGAIDIKGTPLYPFENPSTNSLISKQ